MPDQYGNPTEAERRGQVVPYQPSLGDYSPTTKAAVAARNKSGVSTRDVYLNGQVTHDERATPKRDTRAGAPAFQGAFMDDPFFQRSDVKPALMATNRDTAGGGAYGMRDWMHKHPLGVQAAMIAIAAGGAALTGAAGGGAAGGGAASGAGGGAAAGGEGAVGWGGAGTGGFAGASDFAPGMIVGGGNAGQLAAAGGIAGGAGAAGIGSGVSGAIVKGANLAQQLRSAVNARQGGATPAPNPTLGDVTSSSSVTPMRWGSSGRPLRRFQRTPETIFQNFRATG